MISISSLAQRFRPRPTVLPPSSSLTSSISTPTQQHSIHQSVLSSAGLATPTISLVSSTSASHTSSSQTDSTNLVGDPILGGSPRPVFTSQDTALGTFPMHVLTPIVSLIFLKLIFQFTVKRLLKWNLPRQTFSQVRLSKVLNFKKEKISALKDMNTEV